MFSDKTLKTFDWIAGLTIRELAVFGKEAEHPDISLQLSSLLSLIIKSVSLTKLDLSNVPHLVKLSCDDNKLTELNLSNTPNLTDLSCDDNKLTELNLSNMPTLTDLGCGQNKLTDLDLSGTSELTVLGCNDNKLTELDLSRAPKLRLLFVYEALAKRLRWVGCIYTTMRSQVALGG